MIDRTRLTRLALAAATLSGFLAACSKPAADVQPPAGAEAAPTTVAEPAPPPPPAPAALPEQAAPQAATAAQAAVTTINLSNCETTGNKGQTTVIDWQPTDPNAPVEVRWMKQGNGTGLTVVVKPLAGQPAPILAMFDARYEIGPTADSVVSGLPKNPPFNGGNEVRWKYQVQVLNSQAKVICGLDPEVCVKQPGGCSF